MGSHRKILGAMEKLWKTPWKTMETYVNSMVNWGFVWKVGETHPKISKVNWMVDHVMFHQLKSAMGRALLSWTPTEYHNPWQFTIRRSFSWRETTMDFHSFPEGAHFIFSYVHKIYMYVYICICISTRIIYIYIRIQAWNLSYSFSY